MGVRLEIMLLVGFCNSLLEFLKTTVFLCMQPSTLQWWCKNNGNQKFDWKIKIGLYLANYSGMHCFNVNVLNIGLFQFPSQISVTLVSMHFTPPLVNPIYKHLSR